MLKLRLGKGSVAIITCTIWALVGFALERFIGYWFLPVACIVAALVLGVVFANGVGAGANLVFFVISVPIAIAKTWHLGAGAAVGLFAAGLVVALGLLLLLAMPSTSPIVALMMRNRLRSVAAIAGTSPVRADDGVRSLFHPTWPEEKNPFKYPVVHVPGQDTTLVFTIDRELVDRWAAPVALPVAATVRYHHWPDGLAGTTQTPLTEHVTLEDGPEPLARYLLTPGLQRFMRDEAVMRVCVHRDGVVAQFDKSTDVKKENLLERAEAALALVREVTAATVTAQRNNA